MQIFLACCSQMRRPYLGLVSDLLFLAHLLTCMAEVEKSLNAHWSETRALNGDYERAQ